MDKRYLLCWRAYRRSRWDLSSPNLDDVATNSSPNFGVVADCKRRVRRVSFFNIHVQFGSLPFYRITVGYHRCYSHKSFRATTSIKAVFAMLGASACQGSIKVIAPSSFQYVATSNSILDTFSGGTSVV